MSDESNPRVTGGGLPSWLTLPVTRRVLFAIGAVVWTAVGILLMVYTVTWLAPVPLPGMLGFVAGGLVVAVIFVRFVFSGIVKKNIVRIDAGPERASAWAFQGWKSYLVTVFMVGLGITLRHSPIPKPELAVIYEGIGVALLYTSLLYYRRLPGAARA
jgi:hypothetical protein